MAFKTDDFSEQFLKAVESDVDVAADLLASKVQIAKLTDKDSPTLKKAFEKTVLRELSSVASVAIVDGKPMVVAKNGHDKAAKAVERAYDKLEQQERLKQALCPV